MNDVRSMYWSVRGNFDEIKQRVEKFSADEMRRLIINEHYNDFCRSYCDGRGEEDGKSIPYMGWFWRNTNFADLKIPIGFSDAGDGYIGIMENNKWGYPERLMTEEEALHFIGRLDAAIEASRSGGLLKDIQDNTWAHINDIAPWMKNRPKVVS